MTGFLTTKEGVKIKAPARFMNSLRRAIARSTHQKGEVRERQLHYALVDVALMAGALHEASTADVFLSVSRTESQYGAVDSFVIWRKIREFLGQQFPGRKVAVSVQTSRA